MSTMADLVRTASDVDEAAMDRLHALVADWQLVADLSFADLVLWVPVRGSDAWVAVAQMRPLTAPTCYLDDTVGTWRDGSQAGPLATALTERRIVREGDPTWRHGIPVREEAIPVPPSPRRGRRDPGTTGPTRTGTQPAPLAVLGRDTNLNAPRSPSRLELVYLECAGCLAEMVADGSFPFQEQRRVGTLPRVGDGLVRLDADGGVVYASPNAVSAYRRLGFPGDLVGARLASVTARLVDGPVDPGVEVAASGRLPWTAEAATPGAAVALRSIPLRSQGAPAGAVVLVHDVTELRSRDRQLMTKDATIREIHHRVKNNLQTVAALLRLQARRLGSPEARAALHESVRRVSSIALVHETLSMTDADGGEETVDLDDVVRRVLVLVQELDASPVGSPEPRPRVRLVRGGRFGMVTAQTATPLAIVLTELVQNAMEHAFADGGGTVRVLGLRAEGRLRLTVADDGRGLPPGFTIDGSRRLGLQIARTLIEGELGGSLQLGTAEPKGTEVVVELPVTELSGPAATVRRSGPAGASDA